jgi:glucose/arabinose dehydrogenase
MNNIMKSIVILIFLIALGGFLFFTKSYDEYIDTREPDVSIESTFTNSSTTLILPLPNLELAQKTVFFEDGSKVSFKIAKPFEIKIATEGLGKARFMAMSPDGRLFIPDLVNYNLSHEGSITVLENFNKKTGKFETKNIYLSNLRGVNDVLFYKDQDGQDWIYIALTAHLLRYPYMAGDNKPSGKPEIIIEFPNEQSPGEVSVVWHITRTLSIHDDRIYISVGSGCNACEELAGKLRGMIYSIKPDGSDPQIYADGLRNAVGIEWAEDDLYATANGVDHLGKYAPNEMIYKLSKGLHYGWPYCYELDGKSIQDTSEEWQKQTFSCDYAPVSLSAFEPHSAPLGLKYFQYFHQTLNNSFLVALHGSFDKDIKAGYQIMRVSKKGEQQIFMSGFQTNNGERIARPVDILQIDKESFFFTDDHGGRLYYVYIN